MALNLIMVHHPWFGSIEVYREIARHAREADRRVRPLVVTDRPHSRGRWCMALRRSLIFAAVPLEHFRPVRGALFVGRDLTKSRELEVLGRAGVPVPRWWKPPVRDGLPEDAPYVVVKPEVGRRGHQVKLMRRGRALNLRDPSRLLQEFVYTGPHPESFRVTTLFGEVLYAIRFSANPLRRPVPPPERMREERGGGGLSIVATAKDGRVEFTADPEVLALARRAHDAFPDVPLLGTDIVRDASSGRLCVLEVNARGFTLHFDSEAGHGLQRSLGARFETQFDGLRLAGRVLAERTRACAR